MSKQAVFTMKLEPELRAEFMAEAEAAHRPASQVLRELMREFVQRQRESREYDARTRQSMAKNEKMSRFAHDEMLLIQRVYAGGSSAG